MVTKERFVFVIDEFPYLAKAFPAISSMLQHLIDHIWSEGKLYLILCSSWWGNDPAKKREIQIEIVAPSTDEREFIIGSCKYRNDPVGLDEFNLLQKYAAAFRKSAQFHYYIFSKSGFTRDLQAAAERGEGRLVSLVNLYGQFPHNIFRPYSILNYSTDI